MAVFLSSREAQDAPQPHTLTQQRGVNVAAGEGRGGQAPLTISFQNLFVRPAWTNEKWFGVQRIVIAETLRRKLSARMF